MKCPNDQTTLLISERQNIEIDYCPECRGVWLDRGELDKLITANNATPSQSFDYNQNTKSPEVGAGHRYESSYNSHNPKKKSRESFLGDLFDF